MTICAETALADALEPALSAKVMPALTAAGIETLEDLYECIANVGGNWFRGFPGIGRDEAENLIVFLAAHQDAVGEITERFYPAGSTLCPQPPEVPPENEPRPLTLETVRLSEELSGAFGTNRGADIQALPARDDKAAIELWLTARAQNTNTRAQYRKEAERFLLWSVVERGKAMSSIDAADASLYPVWLEGLGRREPEDWEKTWHTPQSFWIGPKNAARLSRQWRPFNGPLTAASRKTALTVVRLLFAFLTKTGYLRFNPFDQVSGKVHLLPGEGAPAAFADRSLTPRQWEGLLTYLAGEPDGLAKSRLLVILGLGKGLGMRASEIIAARTGWIQYRRIGDEDMRVIEIVGKGDKIRRLPLPDETANLINGYLSLRELPSWDACPADTPLLDNLGRGRGAAQTGISRSGLYRALTEFFRAAALQLEQTSPSDAAKLRASSTHWLRHTFATSALKVMDINVVQNAMGHASIGTTSRYLTPEEAEVAAAMKKMKAL